MSIPLLIMSLQKRILNINNQLISLFATIDSWLDKEENIQNIIEDIISRNQETVDAVSLVVAPSVNPAFAFAASPETDVNPIADDTSTDNRAELQVAALRETLRNQLFFLLFTLDNLHTDCLNPFDTMDELKYPQVLKEMETLLSELSAKAVFPQNHDLVNS